MQHRNQVSGNEIIVYADSSLYSKESIFKCLYWYGNEYHTSILSVDGGMYRISVMPRTTDNLSSDDLDNLLLKVERDLIDFNLRDIVSKETKNIRELLIAKAFSNGEFDEAPPGEIADPVGFNINDVKSE